jgi:hypothetical protein
MGEIRVSDGSPAKHSASQIIFVFTFPRDCCGREYVISEGGATTMLAIFRIAIGPTGGKRNGFASLGWFQ